MLVDIIINLVDVCVEDQVDLEEDVPGFEIKRNEWQIALLQIYERLLRKDLKLMVEKKKREAAEANGSKKKKKKGAKDVIKVQDGDKAAPAIPTYAEVIRPFLEHLHERRLLVVERLGEKEQNLINQLDIIKIRLNKIHGEAEEEFDIPMDFIDAEYDLDGNKIPRGDRLGRRGTFKR